MAEEIDERQHWVKTFVGLLIKFALAGAGLVGCASLIFAYIQTRQNTGTSNQLATQIALQETEIAVANAIVTLQAEAINAPAPTQTAIAEEINELTDESGTLAETTPFLPSPSATQTEEVVSLTPTPLPPTFTPTSAPPTSTPRINTPSGAILLEGEEWYQDSLGITLAYYGQEDLIITGGYSFQGDCVLLVLHNYTGEKLFLDLATTLTDFYIEDPHGNQYRFNWYRLGTDGRYTDSFGLTSIDTPPDTEIGLCLVGPIVNLDGWEYLRVGIRHMLNVRDAIWQINIRPTAPNVAELPQPTSTPLVNAQPGMILNLYDEWYQDGFGVTLTHYGQQELLIPGGYSFLGDCVHFMLRNYTNEKLFIDGLTTLADFYIEDPDGNQYRFNYYRLGTSGRYAREFGLTSVEGSSVTEMGFCLVDPVVQLDAWEYFRVGIQQLFTSSDAQWQINLR